MIGTDYIFGRKNGILIEESPLYADATEIFSYRRITASAVFCCRVVRNGDGAQTDVFLPDNINEFISLDSMTSAGITLGDWVYAVPGPHAFYNITFYGQKGFKNAIFEPLSAKYTVWTGGTFYTMGANGVCNYTLAGASSGFKATDLNNGNPIADTTICSVHLYRNGGLSMGACGWGNAAYDGLPGIQRIMPNPENGISYIAGGAIAGSSGYSGSINMSRVTIKSGDYFSDYINGAQNIPPTLRAGNTNITDDFNIMIWKHSINFGEAIVFLNDKTPEVYDIMAEQRAAFGF